MASRGPETIAIVGTGVAAVTAAQELRALGYEGRVRLFERTGERPFERPALSKGFLADSRQAEPPALPEAAAFAELGVELELGNEVVDLDLDRRVLVDSRGAETEYAQLLLATGAVPRRLALPGADLAGVFYLRGAEDARALRAGLRPGARVVVIGGGVIGLEVAVAAGGAGAGVTVVEVSPQVMGRLAPEGLARELEDHHRAAGLELMIGTCPVALEGSAGRVAAVRLESGELVHADTVVVGIGAEPVTDLAARAGLEVDGGIVVDGRLRSSREAVFAAGDAARVYHPRVGRHLRFEQWEAAREQGRLAAGNMLGAEDFYEEVPWMWSDQGELHFEATGFGFDGAELACRGQLEDRAGLACFGLRDGCLVAACGMSIGTGVTRTVRAARSLIAAGLPVDAGLLADPDTDLRRVARTMITREGEEVPA